MYLTDEQISAKSILDKYGKALDKKIFSRHDSIRKRLEAVLAGTITGHVAESIVETAEEGIKYELRQLAKYTTNEQRSGHTKADP